MLEHCHNINSQNGVAYDCFLTQPFLGNISTTSASAIIWTFLCKWRHMWCGCVLCLQVLSWIDVCAGMSAKTLAKAPCVTASVDAVHFLRCGASWIKASVHTPLLPSLHTPIAALQICCKLLCVSIGCSHTHTHIHLPIAGGQAVMHEHNLHHKALARKAEWK